MTTVAARARAVTVCSYLFVLPERMANIVAAAAAIFIDEASAR
jgi:hypothetical protein